MAEIEILSTTLVQAPAKHKSINRKIALTCSDLKLILVGSIQKGLLFHKPELNSKTLIQHLKSSLSQTLQFFYPLAGRLSTIQHRDDNTISFFIDCNNSGARFVHAVAENVTVSHILQPICIPPIVASFFPLTEIRNYEGISNPLLGVQITELSDGIFVGVTINHSVADGKTFWNFINSWSEISRGLDHISKNPVFENWFRNYTVRLPVSILCTPDEFTPPQLEEIVFNFSKENIARLKEKANYETGVENAALSSLQSVLAHLWQAVVRNRETEPENDTKMVLQIGYRGRLKPEISEEYFGNAVQLGTALLKAKHVIEKGVGFVAWQLNKLVSTCTQEKIENDIESWIKDPKFSKMSGFTRDTLVVGSSPRFNVYGNDFGWGKPIAVRSGPANKFDGKITLFPGLEFGSIDIEVCLSPHVLQRIRNDSEFMDVVTV